jgi:hypothetical protein
MRLPAISAPLLLASLLALGWVQSAVAWLDNVHCLRGRPGNRTQSHACTRAPRTDRAGSGRVGLYRPVGHRERVCLVSLGTPAFNTAQAGREVNSHPSAAFTATVSADSCALPAGGGSLHSLKRRV